MSWEIIAAIVAKEGITVAFQLWKNALDGAEVTPEKWDELLKARKPAEQILAEVRAAK